MHLILKIHIIINDKMVDKIDMSLDEIIKSQKPKAGGVRGASGARRGGGRPNRGGGVNTDGRRRPVGGATLKGRGRGGGIQKAKFARVKNMN